MPAPDFEIRLPMGMIVLEEPSCLGHLRKPLWAALIGNDGCEERPSGIVLCRQPKPGLVRSLTVFGGEINPLAAWLLARQT